MIHKGREVPDLGICIVQLQEIVYKAIESIVTERPVISHADASFGADFVKERALETLISKSWPWDSSQASQYVTGSFTSGESTKVTV